MEYLIALGVVATMALYTLIIARWISQEITRVFEPSARDILHKIYARHLLKLFAQMIRTDVNCFRHLAERKFFA